MLYENALSNKLSDPLCTSVWHTHEYIPLHGLVHQAHIRYRFRSVHTGIHMGCIWDAHRVVTSFVMPFGVSCILLVYTQDILSIYLSIVVRLCKGHTPVCKGHAPACKGHTPVLSLSPPHYIQLDCRSAVGALHTWAMGGKSPVWFRPLVVRILFLGLFTAAIMFLRVTIMKAELPVFTV